MKRYVIKKYVIADSLQKALEQERKVKPDDAWLDEKQPEEQKDQIGFDLEGSGYYYSPYLKRKKRKSKK